MIILQSEKRKHEHPWTHENTSPKKNILNTPQKINQLGSGLCERQPWWLIGRWIIISGSNQLVILERVSQELHFQKAFVCLALAFLEERINVVNWWFCAFIIWHQITFHELRGAKSSENVLLGNVYLGFCCIKVLNVPKGQENHTIYIYEEKRKIPHITYENKPSDLHCHSSFGPGFHFFWHDICNITKQVRILVTVVDTTCLSCGAPITLAHDLHGKMF